MKAEVKNELIGNPGLALNRNDMNNGLMDVDMLDVADLEKQRAIDANEAHQESAMDKAAREE